MKVREILNLSVVNGDVGVEVEAVLRDADVHIPREWRVCEDHSLHDKGLEFVLRQPVKISNIHDRLSKLCDCIEEEFEESHRAGVHVHINVQDLNIVELYNFITAYICYEDVLVELCGEGRSGNFFCLRTRDAEFLLDSFLKVLDDRKFTPLDTDDLRYASLNPKAIVQYGSLEFRAMESTCDPDRLSNWVGMLHTLKESSRSFSSPLELVQSMLSTGVEDSTNHLFEEYATTVKSIPLYEEKVRDCLLNYGQAIAHHVDWDTHFTKQPETKHINPFIAAKKSMTEDASNGQKIYL